MMKIMFICTGNICRSAMAEKMMAKMAKDENKDIEVFSSGIFAENGDCSTNEAIEVMKDYDIDLSKHRATNIKSSNIEDMDLILCATLSHKYGVIKMYPHLKSKVFTIKEYVNESSDDIDVKDPWGCNIVVYKNCSQELKYYIEKIFKKL